ncbi:MAG: hypothetical protein GTO24_14605 [candidate division Zixibacteria bacterium]|nr:hypothetical protein [candidate division Zixibacteria bacterium]
MHSSLRPGVCVASSPIVSTIVVSGSLTSAKPTSPAMAAKELAQKKEIKMVAIVGLSIH